MGEGRGIYSVAMFHVGASDISLAPTFFKSQGALILLPLLLREKSRSARLFGCSGLKSRLRPSQRLAVATNFLRVCALRRWRFILSHLYKVMSKEVDC